MPGRDAKSVLCPFSFQPCVGDYVGRAHMYANFGALACMRSRSPSATSYFLVCWGGGSQLRVFFYSVKRHDTFSTCCHHHPEHPRQFSYFSGARRIFNGFPGRKSQKHCPDVTQHPFCVRFRSNLAWGPTLAVPTCTHTLVQLHACDHVAGKQPATSLSAGEGVPNYGFFSTPSNVTTLFLHVAITIHSTHNNSRIFPVLGAFSRVFQVENRKTLPGRDATSVLCPFSFQPCVGAYVGVPTCTHTLVQLHACDHVAPVQPATSRSAGEEVPNYGFFLFR